MKPINLILLPSTFAMDCPVTSEGEPIVSIKEECDADELDAPSLAQNNEAVKIDTLDCFNKTEDIVSMNKDEVTEHENEPFKTEVEECGEQTDFNIEATAESYPEEDENDIKLHVEDLVIDNEELDDNEVEEDPLLKMQPCVILLRLTEHTMARVIELHRTPQQDITEDCAAGPSSVALHNTQDWLLQESLDARKRQKSGSWQQGKAQGTVTVLDRAIEGKNIHACQLCQFNTVSRGSMEMHYLSSHSNGKPYSCTVCGAGFSHEVHLNDHQQVKCRRKHFGCKLCPYRCHQSISLKLHMRSHTEINSFKCSVCSQLFKNARFLQNHMISHSGAKPFDGVKPFKCNVCSRRFRAKQNYKMPNVPSAVQRVEVFDESHDMPLQR